MTKIHCYLSILLVAVLSSRTVQAWTSPDQAFSLSGYGTLALTYDDLDDAAFVRELTQRPHGTEGTAVSPMTHALLTDSRLGLQGMYRFGQTAELVAQINLRDQETLDLDSSLEWAFVGLHPRPAMDFRLGRVGFDAFLMSDYRQLGYSYPWVRPPVEFYGWLPVYSLDGADFVYRIDDEDGTGNWSAKLQLGAASTDFPFGPLTYEFEGDILTLSLTRETGPWRIRAGFSRVEIGSEIPIAELHGGLDSIVALGIPGISTEAANLRGNMSYDGASLKYYTLGAAYDDGDWLIQGELGIVDASADMVSNGTAGYLSVGRRFGDWTPYILYSRVESNQGPRTAQADWSAIGQADFQQLAIGAFNSTRFDQSSLSLGTRWDFHPQAALKIQWDRFSVEGDGYGLWWVARDRSRHLEIDLLTLSMEFIF